MNDETIKYLLGDYRSAHSEFQINNFIIGGEVDDWARYRQALREIDARYKSLISKKDDLELFDLKKKWFRFGKKARIEKRIRQRMRDALLNGIQETERELKIFVEIALKYKEKFGDIDHIKRQILEADSWRQKAIKMAAVDLIVGGRLSQPTVGLILSLPQKDRENVLTKIKTDPHKLIGL
jgi:hypothetical protein